jgi:hypothetical protein
MVRVEDRDGGDAAAAAFLDREVHRHRRRRMAEPGIGVEERRDRGLADDARLGRHVEPAVAAQLLVHHQHRDAVRIDAHEVGLDHRLDGGPKLPLAHAPGAEDQRDLLAERRGGGCCRSVDGVLHAPNFVSCRPGRRQNAPLDRRSTQAGISAW